jgi:hypothetical protein
MKKFQEYLDTKGKVKGATVKVVAGDVENAPGREKMPPKEAYGPSNGKQQPYSPDGKKVVTAKGKPFGDQGNGDKPYDITHKVKNADIPTAEFAYHELLPKVRDAIKSYPAITENLVRELQRNNLLGVLVGEMLSHNETYKHIAEVMASKNHGEGVCRKLAKAMREGVAAPFHHHMDHGDEMDDSGLDPNQGLTSGGAGMPRPSMNFGGGDTGLGSGGDGSDEFGHGGNDDFGDDDGMGGGGDDQFGGGDDQFSDDDDDMGDLGDDDPHSSDDPNADPSLDPNADPYADPNAPPPALGPDGQPLPPDPNTPLGPDGQPQPALPPRPMGPPAMENMRRAMHTVFEGYKPLSRPVIKPKKRRK